jgi:hypothetical protein
MASDLEIPQELYDSEINFSISCFWDAGFEIRLGSGPGFDAEGLTYSYAEACRWLKEATVRRYPESDFAKKYREPAS